MRNSLPSLPGTERPNRGLFVDHLGTLLVTPPRGFLSSPEEIEFTEGSLETLFQAGQSGWNIYLVGNESSVHSGKVQAETWETIHSEMLTILRSNGVCPTRSYICIDHPDGQEPHNKDSVYRMPNTGAMYHAAQADGISLPHSWIVGDHTTDLVAGWRAGCHMAGVRTGEGVQDGTLQVEPEILADDLAAFVREVQSGVALPPLTTAASKSPFGRAMNPSPPPRAWGSLIDLSRFRVGPPPGRAQWGSRSCPRGRIGRGHGPR